jgi:hypothetical protein
MVSVSGPRSAAGDLGLGEGVGDAFPAPARKFSDKMPGALYYNRTPVMAPIYFFVNFLT